MNWKLVMISFVVFISLLFLIRSSFSQGSYSTPVNSPAPVQNQTDTSGAIKKTSVVTVAGPQGEQGPMGPTGPMGIQGPMGLQGPQGLRGYEGEQGLQGIPGEMGPTGPQGLQGLKGDRGETGPQGLQGLKGDRGETGPQGLQGLMGLQGFKGDRGEIGPTGPQGLQGLKGDRGETGPQGLQGLMGLQGLKGDRGEMGPTGPQGLQGLMGLQGTKGDRGEMGPTGPQGISGLQDICGATACTLTNDTLCVRDVCLNTTDLRRILNLKQKSVLRTRPMVSVVPVMKSKSVNGFSVRASSELGSTNSAWRVFDNSDGSEWATKGQKSNYWIDIQLPSPMSIEYIWLKGRVSEYPITMNVSVSNDGSVWSQYGNVYTPIPTKPNVFVVIVSPEYKDYLFYRFTFPTSTSISKNPGLSEIRLFTSDSSNSVFPSSFDSIMPSLYPQLVSSIIDCRYPFTFVSNGGFVSIDVSLSCTTTSATATYIMYIDGVPVQMNRAIQSSYPIPVFTWRGTLAQGSHIISFDSSLLQFTASNVGYISVSEDM